MAEEKTPSPQSDALKTEGPKSRSKLLPLIVTAVVSSVLGAGLVFFNPAHVPDKELATKNNEAAKKALEPRFSAHTLELMFNPAEKRRSRTCRINMSFQYIAKD